VSADAIPSSVCRRVVSTVLQLLSHGTVPGSVADAVAECEVRTTLRRAADPKSPPPKGFVPLAVFKDMLSRLVVLFLSNGAAFAHPIGHHAAFALKRIVDAIRRGGLLPSSKGHQQHHQQDYATPSQLSYLETHNQRTLVPLAADDGATISVSERAPVHQGFFPPSRPVTNEKVFRRHKPGTTVGGWGGPSGHANAASSSSKNNHQNHSGSPTRRKSSSKRAHANSTGGASAPPAHVVLPALMASVRKVDHFCAAEDLSDATHCTSLSRLISGPNNIRRLVAVAELFPQSAVMVPPLFRGSAAAVVPPLSIEAPPAQAVTERRRRGQEER
jgi:hypothetical protein